MTKLLCGSLRNSLQLSAVKKYLNAENAKFFTENHSVNYSLFTNLFNPSTIRNTLKFINKPNLQPDNFK